jgi:hypothetical protein
MRFPKLLLALGVLTTAHDDFTETRVPKADIPDVSVYTIWIDETITTTTTVPPSIAKRTPLPPPHGTDIFIAAEIPSVTTAWVEETVYVTVTVQPSESSTITSVASPSGIDFGSLMVDHSITSTYTYNPSDLKSDSTMDVESITFTYTVHPSDAVKRSTMTEDPDSQAVRSTSNPAPLTAARNQKWIDPTPSVHEQLSHHLPPIHTHNWLRRFRNLVRQDPITITVNPATFTSSPPGTFWVTSTSTIIADSDIPAAIPLVEITATPSKSRTPSVLIPSATTGQDSSTSETRKTSSSKSSAAATSDKETSSITSSRPTPTTMVWDYWKGTKWQKQGTMNKARSNAAKRDNSDGDTGNRTLVVGFSMLVGALVLLTL